MPIEFNCKSCQKLLKTPDDSGGKSCKCPHCSEVMQIPNSSASQAGPSQAGPPQASPPPGPPPGPAPGSQYPQQQQFGQHPQQQPGSQYPPQKPIGQPSHEAMNPFSAPVANPGPVYGQGMQHGMKHHRGAMILTFGIISTVFSLVSCTCCGIFGMISLALGIPAWVMAASDKKAMAARQMDPSGMGITQAGMILGIIGVCLSSLGLILTIGFIVLSVLAEAGNF